MVRSTSDSDSALLRIEQEGYVIIPQVFAGPEVGEVAEQLAAVLNPHDDEAEAIRSSRGSVYAARNLLRLYPHVQTIWRRPVLEQLLASLLGPELGLVRVLFFDKPPDRSWSLPWHTDNTIAVRNNRLPSQVFVKPTNKAGVPHVEAPRSLLERMITLRIHLDPATEENGPVQVMAGSHRAGEATAKGEPTLILAQPGDVLVMRPLLLHSSGSSRPGTLLHRRILHLEFSGQKSLPDGYEWHDYG